MPDPTHRTRTAAALAAEPAHHLTSPKEVARRFDVSERTVRRWITDGRIPGYRVGPRLVKVDLRDVEALLRPITDGAA